MRLKLNLDGVTFYLKITDYAKTTSADWDLVWCCVEACMENHFMHYEFGGEILLASEVDCLSDDLDGLLNDRLTEPKTFECMEPDLEFVLKPKKDLRNDPRYTYVREGDEIEDIDLEMIVHLWNGTLSGNSIHLSLYREEIQALLVYFQYVKRALTNQSAEVMRLVEEGVLLSEYA